MRPLLMWHHHNSAGIFDYYLNCVTFWFRKNVVCFFSHRFFLSFFVRKSPIEIIHPVPVDHVGRTPTLCALRISAGLIRTNQDHSGLNQGKFCMPKISCKVFFYMTILKYRKCQFKKITKEKLGHLFCYFIV